MSNDCNTCKYEKLKLNEKPCCSCSCCEDENMKWAPKEESKLNKNYIQEFMDDNALKIEQEFSIRNNLSGKLSDKKYVINKDCRVLTMPERIFHDQSTLIHLLRGLSKIVLPPFSPTNLPKQGEQIWFVAAARVITYNFDSGYFWMLACVASGNAFRTEAEAEEAAPRIRKEQGMTK